MSLESSVESVSEPVTPMVDSTEATASDNALEPASLPTSEATKPKIPKKSHALDNLLETAGWYASFERDDTPGSEANIYERRKRKSVRTFAEEAYAEEEERKERLLKEKRLKSMLKQETKDGFTKAKKAKVEYPAQAAVPNSTKKSKAKSSAKNSPLVQPALIDTQANKQNTKPASKSKSKSKSRPSIKQESESEVKQVKANASKINGYISFVGQVDNSEDEIPIPSNFFIPEIVNDTVHSVKELSFKTASEVTKLSIGKYKPYPNLTPVDIEIKSIIFPNLKESYHLMEAGDFKLDPFNEIGCLMELFSKVYIPPDYRLTVYNPKDPYNSIVGRYAKGLYELNYDKIFDSIEEFNSLISKLHKNNEILNYIKTKKTISKTFLHHLLNQIYQRSVSLEIHKLKQYKAFSNFVYGELLPNFLSKVYKQVGLNEKSVFMDLGSGVGNCVIQAALEFGCESYGCEIMKNASELGDLQLIEFKNRCKYFGLNPGKVEYFNNQSFVNNSKVKAIVDKCDIILVNNYIFTPDLNDEVIKLFKDIKTGTKIISLKSLVPAGYVINDKNIESVINRFKVEKFILENGSVSWTDKGGVYYISEVLPDINEEFFTIFRGRRANR